MPTPQEPQHHYTPELRQRAQEIYDKHTIGWLYDPPTVADDDTTEDLRPLDPYVVETCGCVGGGQGGGMTLALLGAVVTLRRRRRDPGTDLIPSASEPH